MSTGSIQTTDVKKVPAGGRDIVLDIAKSIACILVIFSHAKFQDSLGELLAKPGQIAALFFFMVSGYYTVKDGVGVSLATIKRRLIHILKILALALLLYAIYSAAELLVYGPDKYLGMLTPYLPLRFVFLCEADLVNAGHLWFIIALAEGYAVTYLFTRFNWWKAAPYLTVIGLLGKIIIFFLTENYDLDWHVGGFFLVSAVPFMFTARLIAENREKADRIPSWLLWVLLIICVATFVIPVYVDMFDISGIGKTFLAIVVFLLILRIPRKNADEISWLGRAAAFVGDKLSLYIYIIHNLIYFVLLEIVDRAFERTVTALNILPILTVILALIVSYIFYIYKTKTAEAVLAVPEERNFLLDVIKAFCCVFVIFSHVKFPGRIGAVAFRLGGIGVSYFFLSSGFYINVPGKDPIEVIKKRLKRIIHITLIAFLLFFVLTSAEILVHGPETVLGRFSWQTPWRLPALCDVTFLNADHLWFLVAIIEAYLFIWLIEKLKLRKVAFRLLIPLLIIKIAADLCVDNTTAIEWNYGCIFLISSLPLMLAGYCISVNSERFARIPAWTLWLVLAAAFANTVWASFSRASFTTAEISRTLFALPLFLLALRGPQLGRKNLLGQTLFLIGNRLSLYVYILHIFVFVLMLWVVKDVASLSRPLQYLFPIAVAAVTLVLSMIVHVINSKIVLSKRLKEAENE